MADNVAITPGSGATAAADDIGGVLFQRVKVVHGADGVNDGDVSAANPLPVVAYGELVEAIQALRMAMQSLTRSAIGQVLPDVAGAFNSPIRVPVLAQNPTAANLTATVSLAASQTLTTLSTLSNQTNIGSFAANIQIPTIMILGGEQVRRNITVT